MVISYHLHFFAFLGQIEYLSEKFFLGLENFQVYVGSIF